MELWDILDENGNKIGKTVKRGDPLSQDEYHLVVHVWIKNSEGEYLISKRTPNKTYPQMWETTGGSAIVGENSLQAALREVKEEIGIDLTPSNGKIIYRYKKQCECSYFVDVWLFEENVDISKVVYQKDEVCDALWATLNQISKMIETGEFIKFSYLKSIFNT